MIYRFLIIIALSILSACSSNVENDFLCAAQIGSPCASISDVDGKNVNISPVHELSQDSSSKQITNQTTHSNKLDSSHVNFSAPYRTSSYRTKEKVGRIWIAPFIDGNNILNEGRYIHFVVTPAKWVRK